MGSSCQQRELHADSVAPVGIVSLPMSGSLLPGDLETPTTVVLADRLERNLSAMADFCKASSMALRPHAKTHKTVEIANMQMDLGAVGLSVATVGEAEFLVRGHPSATVTSQVDDVFLAYPLWATDDLLVRLRRLTERARVSVGTDSVAAVECLAPLAGRLRIMIEIDSGLSRTGVHPSRAGVVAQAADRAGLEVAGVFTFPGQSYLPGAGAEAASEEASSLAQAAEVLADIGFEAAERSGGSTPSAPFSGSGSLSELRPGVYVFNDAQQVELGTVAMDEVALMVAATVVSCPEPGRIVLDSGAKVIGPDRPAWASGHGRLADWPDARIIGLWEHHAVVAIDGPTPKLGEVVAVVPNHVCTAVNLVPELLVVDGGKIVDRWAVVARAANR